MAAIGNEGVVEVKASLCTFRLSDVSMLKSRAKNPTVVDIVPHRYEISAKESVSLIKRDPDVVFSVIKHPTTHPSMSQLYMIWCD